MRIPSWRSMEVRSTEKIRSCPFLRNRSEGQLDSGWHHHHHQSATTQWMSNATHTSSPSQASRDGPGCNRAESRKKPAWKTMTASQLSAIAGHTHPHPRTPPWMPPSYCCTLATLSVLEPTDVSAYSWWVCEPYGLVPGGSGRGEGCAKERGQLPYVNK